MAMAVHNYEIRMTFVSRKGKCTHFEPSAKTRVTQKHAYSNLTFKDKNILVNHRI